jgi:DNA-binding MarR family transcriptional regulator
MGSMPESPDDELLADLADLVLNVGRLIRARTPVGSEIVALTETERQIMRLIDLHPGCAPSDIAARGRLQRTNVSTALRSLEAKGMIERSHTGRQVTVTATRLAATNLQALRSAWGHELVHALHADTETIRQCNDLLSALEQRLTEPID